MNLKLRSIQKIIGLRTNIIDINLINVYFTPPKAINWITKRILPTKACSLNEISHNYLNNKFNYLSYIVVETKLFLKRIR